MKKIVLAAAAVSLFISGAASAADLAAPPYTKAPPPAAVVYDWTGFYIGGNVGGLRQDNVAFTNFTQTSSVSALLANPQATSLANTSAIGGVHAGYNWQVTKWVFGVEGDWDWTGAKNSFCRQTDINSVACTDNGEGFLTASDKTEWLASARGRVGYTWDRMMLYATGGGAWGKIDTDINASCLVDGCAESILRINQTTSFSSTRTGWVAGAGIEAMVAPNWLVRAEYLHYDLGSTNDAVVLPSSALSAPQVASLSRSHQYDTFRAGLSYKFGGPAVVAKY
jgi:outer membrane immunogenic protein